MIDRNDSYIYGNAPRDAGSTTGFLVHVFSRFRFSLHRSLLRIRFYVVYLQVSSHWYLFVNGMGCVIPWYLPLKGNLTLVLSVEFLIR